MPGLPNGDQLVFDLRKLEEYCLSASHPRGRHKARVFREALGLTADHAQWLRDELLEAVRGANAEKLGSDTMGQRWRVDVAIARQDRRAVVRTLWIVRTDETIARFVTCWVL